MISKKLLLNNQEIQIEHLDQKSDSLSFEYKGCRYQFHLDGESSLRDQTGQSHTFLSSQGEVWVSGTRFEIESIDRQKKKANIHKGNLLSPMPGKILKLLVQEGQSVAQGESLLIMEAMKMEHTIKAPFDGVIAKIPFQVGDQIQAKVALIELTPVAAGDDEK
jgi:biotin carboxyl carrier protein